jgi:glycine cleavage system aminomethyltransferase T
VIPDFGDVEGEARAVRESAALFDFSFVARARLMGRNAAAILERFQPRPVADMATGAIRYALRLGADGAVEADLTLWRIDEHVFEMMSGRREDVAALAALAGLDTAVVDLSDSGAIFAVQGPRTLDALAPLADRERLAAIPYFGHAEATIAGIPCRIGRLGYTGEKGFEIVADKTDAERLRAVLAERARPAGFAAADILRIEAGFILFVNECRLGAGPAALGLERLAPHALANSPLRLVAFAAEPAPIRSPWRPEDLHPPARGEIAVTSASASVARRGQTIGLGLVHAADAAPGTRVRDPARRFGEVRVERIPLYDPAKQRPRGPWPPATAGTGLQAKPEHGAPPL